jgi:hypothetical protein
MCSVAGSECGRPAGAKVAPSSEVLAELAFTAPGRPDGAKVAPSSEVCAEPTFTAAGRPDGAKVAPSSEARAELAFAAAVVSDRGAFTLPPQWEHLIVFPRTSALTFNCFPQTEQSKTIMFRPIS